MFIVNLVVDSSTTKLKEKRQREQKEKSVSYKRPVRHISNNERSGRGAHAYNPSTSRGRGRWITRSRDRDHPGKHGETPSLLKIQKLSWAWWCVPVVPATWEAEARELPEPRRRSLQ